MIIVEGPDGAGKTTLINAMKEAWGIEVAPRVVSKDTEALVDLQQWVDENLEAGFQNMIFDRHRLISETIYGPILRFEQEPGFNKMEWLAPRMKRFYELKPVIIYCLPPFDVVERNLVNDPDNRSVYTDIEAIYSAYVSRASLDETFSPGIVKVWDYTRSLTIADRPAWLTQLKREIEDRFK